MKWLRYIGIGSIALFGATTLPVVEVPTNYYVRVAPGDKAQFSSVSRTHKLDGLTEAHIIGKACYDAFIDPVGNLEPIRKRIDCDEYWRRANTPNYPNPVNQNVQELKAGREWSSYVTYLFDTPSGDLEPGYYAIATDKEQIPVAQYLLEKGTPIAQAAISLDATSDQTADSSSVTSLSWSHTVSASASTTVLLGTVMMRDATDAARTVISFKFNGGDLFKIREDDENTDDVSTSIWVMPDPDLGTYTMAVTLDDFNSVADAGAISLHGVSHYLTVDAQSSSAAASGNISGQVTTQTNNAWVFVGAMTIPYAPANAAYTINAPGVEIGNYEDASNGSALSGYYGPQAVAGLASTTWLCAGGDCATNDWITSNVSVSPNCNSPGNRCTQLWRTSGTWVAPVGLTSVDVACWGAGGGGATVASDGGGGGGGGAFASSTVTVTGGNSYPIIIGTGGAVDTVLTTATSSFNGTSVVADGGYGTDTTTGGKPGLASLSTGTVKANGGTGGAGVSGVGDASGGGGGAGGPHGAGANGNGGVSTTPGAGGNGNNGVGGAGGSAAASQPGNPGFPSLLGGGGGGGGGNADVGGAGASHGAGGGGGEAGGAAGASGACLLTWIKPAEASVTSSIINSIIYFYEDQ